ncbi:MAG: flagellum-specific synthase, partial [Gaiellales bacterium]|nr:flagellum-specific synthase [Gaiellales bacterium]
MSIDLKRYTERVRRADPYRVGGRVAEVIGLVVESNGPEVEVGEICSIGDTRRGETVLAQAVGFRTGRTLLMPLSGMKGIRPGAYVIATGRALMAPTGDGLLWRVLDGLGQPI